MRESARGVVRDGSGSDRGSSLALTSLSRLETAALDGRPPGRGAHSIRWRCARSSPAPFQAQRQGRSGAARPAPLVPRV
jgi:hypothetical protein